MIKHNKERREEVLWQINLLLFMRRVLMLSFHLANVRIIDSMKFGKNNDIIPLKIYVNVI